MFHFTNNKLDTLESRLEAQENGHLKWPDAMENGTDMLSLSSLPCVTIAGFEKSRLDANLFTMSSSLVAEQDSYFSTFVDTSTLPPTTAILPDHTPQTPSTSGSNRSSIHVTDLMQAEL